jgi:hypothetical protein
MCVCVYIRLPLRHQKDIGHAFHNSISVVLEKFLSLFQVKNISSIK